MKIVRFFQERKPWMTAILALVLGPVVGMLYLNQGRKAVFYLMATLFLYGLPFAIVHAGLMDFDPVAVAGTLPLILNIIGAAHCFVQAQNFKKEVPLRWYARWHSIVFLFYLLPLFVAVGFRWVIYEPFHIPAGSMSPNINIGDYLFAQKYAYGYGPYSFPLGTLFLKGSTPEKEPERGDIILFGHPQAPEIVYIKRVIGLPGDTVQMRNGKVFINGTEMPQEKANDDFRFIDPAEGEKTIPVYFETLPNGRTYKVLDEHAEGVLDNTEMYRVPDGHYFVLGDNRDNTVDSRLLNDVGFVPRQNITARAGVILWNGQTRKFSYKRIGE